MNIQDFLNKTLGTNSYKLALTDKGLTNKNYMVTLNNNKYMLRVPWEHSTHVVDHLCEEQVIEAIKMLKIDVPLVCYDSLSGMKLSEYVDHLWEFKECPYPNKIARVAKLMKKLHQANLIVTKNFEPLKKYEQYKSHVRNPLYNLHPYESILNDVKQISCNHVLCHNDWVSGNILLGTNQDYLIDYEYGANNDPLFDVMSFISENNIIEEVERQLFYKAYFDDYTEEIKQRLELWEKFHNLLWCTWAMMMWEQRKECVYQEIAKTKWQALCHNFKSK